MNQVEAVGDGAQKHQRAQGDLTQNLREHEQEERVDQTQTCHARSRAVRKGCSEADDDCGQPLGDAQ